MIVTDGVFSMDGDVAPLKVLIIALFFDTICIEYRKFVILLIDIMHWYSLMNVMQLDLSVLMDVELKNCSVLIHRT
jgi:hypothetical protein